MRWFWFLLCSYWTCVVWADVTVVLSDDKPAVQAVARALGTYTDGKIEYFSLRGDGKRGPELSALLADKPASQPVVAIGSLAATVVREFAPQRPMVFCLVLNYDRLNLISRRSKGVSALPSLATQFRVWKALDPSLKSMGMVVGRAGAYMVQQARQVGQAYGIEVVALEIASDREYLPALKRIAPQVQGFWLAPDSSVLSPMAIQDALGTALKVNLPVVVFSPSLLREGALFAATVDYDDVARQVAARLARIQNGDISGEGVQELSSAKVIISRTAARRHGLKLPETFKDAVEME
jgi:putative ABC transport system substrate-binding protein